MLCAFAALTAKKACCASSQEHRAGTKRVRAAHLEQDVEHTEAHPESAVAREGRGSKRVVLRAPDASQLTPHNLG